MKQRTISLTKAGFILTMLFCGSNAVVQFPTDAGQDFWLVLLILAVAFLPVLFLYARLIHLFPGKDLVAMINETVGKRIGFVLNLVFGLHFLLSASLALFNYSSFVLLNSLLQTDFSILVLLYFCAALYLSYSPPNTIGNWCGLSLTLLVAMMTFFFFASLPRMDFGYLKPVLTHTPKEIGQSVVKFASIPFSDVLLLLIFADRLEKGRKPNSVKKVYLISFFTTLPILLMGFLRIICMLGPETTRLSLYQNYRSVSVIHINDFFERMEAFSNFFYLLAGIPRAAICIVGTARAARNTLHQPDLPIQHFLVPIGLVIYVFAIHAFQGANEALAYAHHVQTALCILFSFILPFCLWVIAEIKHRRNKKQQTPLQQLQQEIDQLDQAQQTLSSSS